MAGHGRSLGRFGLATLAAGLALVLNGCQTARPMPVAWSAPSVQPALAAPTIVPSAPPVSAPAATPVLQVSAKQVIPPEAPPVETVYTPAAEPGELPLVQPAEPLVGLNYDYNDYGSDLCTQQDSILPSHREVMRDDLHSIFPTLRDDAIAVYTDPGNLTFLGLSLAATIGIRQDADDEVREYTLEHPGRWGRANDWIEPIGNTSVQLPVLFGLYGYSVYTEDDENLELSRTLVRAYALTGLSTVMVKGVANTDRPSDEFMDGKWGLPSGHSSTSFAIAAVLDEYYGHHVGVPAYIMAGLVGWSRVDHRQHDVSDVVFGSALGYVIGKTVAERVYDPESRFHVLPYSHPTEGTPGIMLHWEY